MVNHHHPALLDHQALILERFVDISYCVFHFRLKTLHLHLHLPLTVRLLREDKRTAAG